MPIKKSAKKANSRSLKQRAVNEQYKISMKKSIKEIKKAVATKADKVEDLLVKAHSLIDKANKKNVLHKNTAARKKSRLTKLVNSLEK